MTDFNLNSFKSLYQTFDSEMLERLSEFYSPNIAFKDPIHQLQGLGALKDYFAGLCNPEQQCSFVFTNQVVTNQQAFLQWQMHYRHPRLNKGKRLTLDGGSLIKFDTSIFYHEDFYDMGAMIYQHIPILGWAVKSINAKLVNAHEQD